MPPPVVPGLFEFDGFTLDLARGCLHAGEQLVDLRPKSFGVLCYLVENAGRVVSKDELAKAVWPGLFVEDEALTHCVSEVRRALGDHDRRIIKTVPRRGYLFLATVSLRRTDSGSTGSPIAASDQLKRDREATPHADSTKAGEVQNGQFAQAPQTLVSLRQMERRQLTVLICEFVGAATLSMQLDAEDLHDFTTAAYEWCKGIVEQYHGHVARYFSDRMLVYFGYPKASEHDADLAVRAGLSLLATDAGLKAKHDPGLKVRVGIASGTVVVGNAPGGDEIRQQTVVGKPITLAERLAAMAKPGTLVIAASTQQLVGRAFDYQEIHDVELEPGQAFEVLGPSVIESRFQARLVAQPVPLLGREEELDMLQRRWRQACNGEGRVVLISGEPGIGKSRLIVALQELLKPEERDALRYFCSPQHANSTLFPVVNQLERAIAFERAASVAQKLARLGTTLGFNPEEAGFVADLLALPTDGRDRPMEASSQKRRERTLAALLGQMERAAQHRPVLVVYEDVHWMDPTTRELLEMAIERVVQLPVLILVSFRPEFQPPWLGAPHVTLLAMNRLTGRSAAALVRHVAGSNALSEELTAEIVQRTDGIPLFVEELTKAIVEKGDGDVPQSASTELARKDIPASLQASLLARLDSLTAAADEAAEIGAAIGREFSCRIVADLKGCDPASVAPALAELEAAGLIQCRGPSPDVSCAFKHALVREAAYSRLLRPERQALHSRIVAALEARSSDLIEAQPELLAQHCAAAGLAERAVIYWERAGLLATSRYALKEAISHFSSALALLHELAPTKECKEREIQLQIALGEAFIASKGYGAREAGRAFSRAYKLIQEIGGSPRLFHVLAGIFIYHEVRAEISQSHAAARELLGLAEERNDVAAQLVAHRDLGDSLLHVGQFLLARTHFERALGLFHEHAAPLFVGEEIGVAILGFLSLCLAILGFPKAAAVRSDESVERARRHAHHAHTLALALNLACRLQFILRNRFCLERRADELCSLSADHGLTYMQAQGTLHRGRALMLAGRFGEGVPVLEEGIAGVRATGAVRLRPFNLGALAVAYQQVGRNEDARCALAEALEQARQTRVGWAKAELQRLEAEMIPSALASDPSVAEFKLRRAITTARRQGAKWWELRASTSLARLWRGQGKSEQAVDLLRPIYGWFTEGFDTLDVIEAKELLGDS
jgi:DNA-binding winged helix-turn-helix (wHTH) protein/predicted ATPase